MCSLTHLHAYPHTHTLSKHAKHIHKMKTHVLVLMFHGPMPFPPSSAGWQQTQPRVQLRSLAHDGALQPTAWDMQPTKVLHVICMSSAAHPHEFYISAARLYMVFEGLCSPHKFYISFARALGRGTLSIHHGALTRTNTCSVAVCSVSQLQFALNPTKLSMCRCSNVEICLRHAVG